MSLVVSETPPPPPRANDDAWPLPLAGERPPRAVTWRSALLGTAGVVLINALAPYNDYIVVNTLLVGSYLPLVIVLAFVLGVTLVNAPLWRFKPAWAMRQGELATVMGMMLVGCAVPTQGLMRQLIPTMISPFHLGAQDGRFWQAFLGMDLPAWLFPVADVAQGRSSPIVQGAYFGRIDHFGQIPFGAWVVPLLGWGVFVLGFWAALLGMAAIVRHQWAEAERLPFPLARVEASLIADPEPGRAFNALFRSRLMWIALVAVVIVHSMAAANRYFPKEVPTIPLRYRFYEMMADPPWSYFGGPIKSAAVYFTFVGVAYFISARVAFSLWAVVLIKEFVGMQAQVFQVEITAGAWYDQHFGACAAFFVGVMWIGRQHWWRVLRQMFGARPTPGVAGEPHAPRGDFIPYGVAGWLMVAGMGVMAGWLIAAGASPVVAGLLVLFLVTLHVVAARVVAQTGFPCFRLFPEPRNVFYSLPAGAMTSRDVFWCGAFGFHGPHPTRESMPAFALHAMQVFETQGPNTDDRREAARQRHRFVLLLAFALVLAYGVSATSWLHAYYTYAMPIAPQASDVENVNPMQRWPQMFIVDAVNRHADGRFPDRPYHPWLHKGIGATITGLLQFLSLRYTWWAFAPVGYLIGITGYGGSMWFSIFLGWLAKVLIVRFGGAGMFERARPLFVGMIIGEALAAGVWMIVTLVLAQLGVDYFTVQLLPS